VIWALAAEAVAIAKRVIEALLAEAVVVSPRAEVMVWVAIAEGRGRDQLQARSYERRRDLRRGRG
jgi:hypothetical protein